MKSIQKENIQKASKRMEYLAGIYLDRVLPDSMEIETVTGTRITPEDPRVSWRRAEQIFCARDLRHIMSVTWRKAKPFMAALDALADDLEPYRKIEMNDLGRRASERGISIRVEWQKLFSQEWWNFDMMFIGHQ